MGWYARGCEGVEGEGAGEERMGEDEVRRERRLECRWSGRRVLLLWDWDGRERWRKGDAKGHRDGKGHRDEKGMGMRMQRCIGGYLLIQTQSAEVAYPSSSEKRWARHRRAVRR